MNFLTRIFLPPLLAIEHLYNQSRLQYYFDVRGYVISLNIFNKAAMNYIFPIKVSSKILPACQ